VLFEQQLTEFPGPGGRRRIALMSRHDGTLHEDMPLPRECIDVADAGLGGQPSDVGSDIRQVPDGCLMNRMLPIIYLDHGREE
jgi:hypothetical protein